MVVDRKDDMGEGWNLLADEIGQDLIEYTLLLAFVALVAAGLFIQAGSVTAGIWGTANALLTKANEPGQ